MKHPIAFISIIVMVAVAAWFGYGYFQSDPASTEGGGFGGFKTPVVVAHPKAEIFYDQIDSIGTTKALESVTLTTKVTETVDRVNFTDGMMVEKGAVLVELSKDEERAQLAEAQATLNEAEKQYTRILDLVKQGNAPESRRDEAYAEVETAKARIEAISARLADRQIRAPFAGRLGFREVSPGTLVAPNTRITTLDDISMIKLDFSIPERFIAAAAEGQKIVAQSAAYPDKQFEGVVSSINSRIDPITRAVTIRALLENGDLRLKPGMLLTVTLTAHERQIYSLPELAIVPLREKTYVFVVNAEDQAHRVEVKLGDRRYGKVEIISGVSPTDRVIVEGTVKVREGGAVKIVESQGGAGPISATGESAKTDTSSVSGGSSKSEGGGS